MPSKKLKIGTQYVNVFSQEVEITDIDIKDDCIVFIDVNNDSADTLRVEEFCSIYKKVDKVLSELVEPTEGEFRKTVC